MDPQAAHPPTFAPSFGENLLRYATVLAVVIPFLVGCGSSNGQTSNKSARSPKTFYQAASGVRPSGSAKSNAPRTAKGYEPTEEQSAVTAIVGIGKPAVPELIKTLRSESPLARRQAALALSRIGPDAKDAVDELIVALDDQDATVRKAAARALGNIGPAAERAVPFLVRVMSGEPADIDMDDAYSVAPPRIQSRSSSAKAQDREAAAKAIDQLTIKNPNYRPPVTGSDGDDVVIETTASNESGNDEVQAANFHADAEPQEAETAVDKTEGNKASDKEPLPPAKYSSPAKLRRKGRP